MSGDYEKRFDTSHWWVLSISGAAYIGIGIYCLLKPAEQVYYMLWIPVSAFIYVGTVVYYIYEYYQDKKEQQFKQDSFKKIEQNAKSALLNIMANKKANNTIAEAVEPQAKVVEMKLGGDTYAMAFKAMNNQACKEL